MVAEHKHTVLFVDDEPHILSALRRLFRREGYQILTAPGGQEGLALLKEQPVSLILSDQRMPEMLGAEFLSRSQEIAPHSVRVMLTGYSDIEAAIQAINEGAISRYITKPWDDEELRMTVREALERFELEERNRELTEELKVKNAELERFNARLEQKVEERTRELQESLKKNMRLAAELRIRVRELRAKDMITRHLLTFHSLQETVNLLLEAVTHVLDMDGGAIFLCDEDGYQPTAGIGLAVSREHLDRSQLGKFFSAEEHREAFSQVQQNSRSVNQKAPRSPSIPPFVVVPFLRKEEVLGFMYLDKRRRRRAISRREIRALETLALQASVAIGDALDQQDSDQWQREIQDTFHDSKKYETLEDALNE